MGNIQKKPIAISIDPSIWPLLILIYRTIYLSSTCGNGDLDHCFDISLSLRTSRWTEDSSLRKKECESKRVSRNKKRMKLLCDHRYRFQYITLLILCLLCNLLYEYTATFVMDIIGDFNSAVQSLSHSQFISTIYHALFVILIVSIFKTFLAILTEQVALMFRKVLVESFHALYFTNRTSYDIILFRESKAENSDYSHNEGCSQARNISLNSKRIKEREEDTSNIRETTIHTKNFKIDIETDVSQSDEDLVEPLLRTDVLLSRVTRTKKSKDDKGKESSDNEKGDLSLKERKSLDNPDQRITNDIYQFTSLLPSFLLQIILAPFLITYYTYVLYKVFGWTAPSICWIYFLIGAMINTFLIKLIIPVIYIGSKLEDTFRYLHSLYRSKIEAIALSNGIEFFGEKISLHFGELLNNKQRIIYAHTPLYLFTNFYEYFGTIVNYAVVGVAVISINNSLPDDDKLKPADIAALVATGAYACIYLISAFSSLFDSIVAIGSLAGIATRILEVQDTMKLINRRNYYMNRRSINANYKVKHEKNDKLENTEDNNQLPTRKVFIENINHSNLKTSEHTSINVKENEKIDKKMATKYGAKVILDVQNLVVAIPFSRPFLQLDEISLHSLQKATSISNTEIEYPTSKSESVSPSSASLSTYSSFSHKPKKFIPASVFSSKDSENSFYPVNQPSTSSFENANYNKILIRDLSFQVYEGRSLLIKGESGCGKTSLLKTLAGLWPALSGSINFPLPFINPNSMKNSSSSSSCLSCFSSHQGLDLPQDEERKSQSRINVDEIDDSNRKQNTTTTPLQPTEEVMFVPQQPYCFKGTLVDLILYPKFHQIIKVIVKKENDGSIGQFLHYKAAEAQEEDLRMGKEEKRETPKKGLTWRREEKKQQKNLIIYLSEIAEVMNLAGLSYLFHRCINNSISLAFVNEERVSVLDDERYAQKKKKEYEEHDPSFQLAPDEIDIYPYLQSYNFDQILSMGEKQRINFARIYFHRPYLVFLDEVTSAVDVAMEEMLYRQLKCMPISIMKRRNRGEMRASFKETLSKTDKRVKKFQSRGDLEGEMNGNNNTSNSFHKLTFVTVGHRDSLASLHDDVITL